MADALATPVVGFTMKSDTGTIKEAYGFSEKNQPKADTNVKFPITFSFEYREWDSVEAATAKEWSQADILSLINASEKTNARASEYQKAVAPIKPDPNSDESLRNSMILNYMKLKKLTREKAEEYVDRLLKLEAK